MSKEQENWLDEILGQTQDPEKIAADDTAADAVGLSRPDDLELEKIVQEAIAANWGEAASEETVPTTEDTADSTQFFIPPQEVFKEQSETCAAPESSFGSDNAATEKSADMQDTFISKPLLFDENIQEQKEAEQSPLYTPVDTTQTEQAPMEATEGKTTARKRSKRSSEGASKPPKKKGGLLQYLKEIFNIPHLLATGIWIALILFIGSTLANSIWLCAEDLLALGKTPQQVTITVDASDSLGDIAEKLEKSGMIRYANLFELFAKITGKGDRINVGEITFSGDTIYDYNALVYAMSYDRDPSGTVSVTIPEGYTCKQIFALLEESGVCSVSELEKYAANGELDDYWFLEGIKRGGRYCLEGFLFPDTYEFYLNDTAEHAISKLLDGFDYRFSDRLKEKFEKLNANLDKDLTLTEVITMASIVQKEKANDPEGYTIASVFYNRLENSASYPFLNSDATANYATDVLGATTESQINASPYNTYTQKGLPPGPICNPGLSSIDAALEPEDTGYYFFVLDQSVNSHVFSKTYDEHQRKLRELGLV